VSVGRLFTATRIAMLYAEGKLDSMGGIGYLLMQTSGLHGSGSSSGRS